MYGFTEAIVGTFARDERGRHELDDAADEDRDQRQHRELQRPRFERAVPVVAVRRLDRAVDSGAACASSSAMNTPCRAVRYRLKTAIDRAGHEERAADDAQRVHRHDPHDGLEEVGVAQRAVGA